jgi:hypothetical protein
MLQQQSNNAPMLLCTLFLYSLKSLNGDRSACQAIITQLASICSLQQENSPTNPSRVCNLLTTPRYNRRVHQPPDPCNLLQYTTHSTTNQLVEIEKRSNYHTHHEGGGRSRAQAG